MAIPDIGVFTVIDLENRMFVDAIEVFLPSEAVRAAMGRAPDIDEPHMISWGQLARAEIHQVFTCTEEEHVEELLLELQQFLANRDAYVWTLYFADASYRE